LNGSYSAFTDAVSVFASNRFAWIPLYAWLLFILYRRYAQQTWKVILAVVLLIVLSDQGSNLLKNSVKRLRPCHSNYLATQVHTYENDCGSMYGFVSSHAANATALTVFILLLLGREHKSLRIVLPLYALLVCWSRIMLGRHYPLDILGGMMLGASLALLLAILLKKNLQKA
jgi:undecaprenyl-diphosphatase